MVRRGPKFNTNKQTSALVTTIDLYTSWHVKNWQKYSWRHQTDRSL